MRSPGGSGPSPWPTGRGARWPAGSWACASKGHPIRWIEARAAPVGPGVDGRWPVVTSLTDISDRIARDRALKQATQRAEAMFSSAPLGMKVTALDGTISEANGALADLLGLPVEDIVGRTSAHITHPEDATVQREHERALLAGDIETHRMEKRLLHADGHLIWVQLDSTVLRDADDAPIGFISQIHDVSERREHEEQLRHLADHDALTGLLNRRGFLAALEHHLERARRYGATGALLMLDLDRFKEVNDTLGHKAGDELIAAAAGVLRGRLRDSDVVARLGGDEFVVLLPEGGSAEAVLAAEAVLPLLQARRAALLGPGHDLGGSIGVAAVCGGHETADELLVRADLALYHAKGHGRGRVATADPPQPLEAEHPAPSA